MKFLVALLLATGLLGLVWAEDLPGLAKTSLEAHAPRRHGHELGAQATLLGRAAPTQSSPTTHVDAPTTPHAATRPPTTSSRPRPRARKPDTSTLAGQSPVQWAHPAHVRMGHDGFPFGRMTVWSLMGTDLRVWKGRRELEVDIGRSIVVLLEEHEHEGVPHLLLGTVASDGRFTLERLHDADGDGFIDLSTRSTLFSLASHFHLSHFTVAKGHWFFLDSRCQDIWEATVENGWPTGLRASPFARSADLPALIHCERLAANDPQRIECLGVSFATVHESFKPYMVLFDQTGVGRATDHVIAPGSLRVGTQWHLHDGQRRIAYEYEHADELTLWVQDEPGAPWTKLALAGEPTARGPVSEITLASPLRAGQLVSFRDLGDEAERLQVGRARPQLSVTHTHYAPTAIVPRMRGQIRLETLDAAGCDLWIRSTTMETPALRLDYAMDKDGVITANLPPRTKRWAGSYDIWISRPGHPRMLDGLTLILPQRR